MGRYMVYSRQSTVKAFQSDDRMITILKATLSLKYSASDIRTKRTHSEARIEYPETTKHAAGISYLAGDR